MSHDGMPRAYLRLDPNIDTTVPDIEMFIRLLCAAARQPERGRFKDRALLDRAIGRTKATKAIARGDVVTLPDGRLYVDGWDQWQEGDFTVADRMRRMRARRAEKRDPSVTPVTVPASPPRNDVTTDAVEDVPSTRRSSTATATATAGNGAAAPSPSTPGQIVRKWLTDQGASRPTGYVNTDLVELVKVHGAEAILGVWEKAGPPDRRTSKEWVKLAERSLSPIGNQLGKANGGHGTEAAERAFNHG